MFIPIRFYSKGRDTKISKKVSRNELKNFNLFRCIFDEESIHDLMLDQLKFN